MINRLPAWFKQKLLSPATNKKIKLLSELNINTVCQEAHCPNLNSCFEDGELTFIILGYVCTRSCLFCAVEKNNHRPLEIDKDEPERIAALVKVFKLNYVVITSVTRDDLEDGGAGQFVKTAELIRANNNNICLETLIPDFLGNFNSLKKITDVLPQVIAHNLETVRRLSNELRPQASFDRSLEVLKTIKDIDGSILTKSSLMLGFGEKEEEVIETLKSLRSSECDILVLGQYLAPSDKHYPVKEFVENRQFLKYKDIASDLGFKAVLAEPKARSSYKAGKLYRSI